MGLPDLKTRENIHLLVTTFYSRVRKDDLIGPVFNGIIPEDKWPAHMERLTDFWESVALGHYTYVGNPRTKHQEVDAHENHSITQAHFDRWLEMWFTTVDSLFEGPLAGHAKNTAEKMASVFFMAMRENRQGNQK